jgi:hypothetical protein
VWELLKSASFSSLSMASLLSFSLRKPSIIKATSLSPTTTSPSTPEVLEEKFGRKGIKFLESNNVPTVELKVRNGSSVRVQIPNAYVSSYKPKVYWKDDGFEEVLYTLPGKEKDSSGIAKGGIGLVINDASEGGSKGSLISSSEWTVKDVDSDSIDAVQVFAWFLDFFPAIVIVLETSSCLYGSFLRKS